MNASMPVQEGRMKSVPVGEVVMDGSSVLLHRKIPQSTMCVVLVGIKLLLLALNVASWEMRLVQRENLVLAM